jgi:hypothetical protein
MLPLGVAVVLDLRVGEHSSRADGGVVFTSDECKDRVKSFNQASAAREPQQQSPDR